MGNRGTRKCGDVRSVAKVLEDATRSGRALELKKRGFTFAAIAVELGYAGKQGAAFAVKSAVNRELLTRVRLPARRLIQHELRRCELEFERLDAILAGLVAKKTTKGTAIGAFDGHTPTAEAALKVSAERRKWAEHRARLLGIVKPADVNVAAGALVIQVTSEVAAAFDAPAEAPQLPPASLNGSAH
jgi:hypothetical protein